MDGVRGRDGDVRNVRLRRRTIGQSDTSNFRGHVASQFNAEVKKR